MSRSRNIERKKQTHQRIIARLYALAVLCERVAIMPAPIRFMVLWMLRNGEVVARDYAEGMALDVGFQMRCPELPSWQDSSADGALRLAAQLRGLGEVLQFLSVYVGAEPRCADDQLAALAYQPIGRANLDCLLRALQGASRQVYPAPDTS